MALAMTVAGTVETFDAASFAAGLAASVGVEAAAVTLTVTAGSVRVNATIRVAGTSTGVVASLQALANNVAALSYAVGVTVESVAPPVVSIVAVDAPSPPPSPLPPSEPPSPAPPHLSPPPLYTALIAAEEAALEESPAISAAIGSLIGLSGLCLVVCAVLAIRMLKTRREFKVWLVDAKKKEMELEAPLPVSIDTLSPLPNVAAQEEGSPHAQEEVEGLIDEVVGEQVGPMMAEVAGQELTSMKSLVSKELSDDDEQVEKKRATAVAETPPQQKGSIGSSGRRRKKHSACKAEGSSTDAGSVTDAAPKAAAAFSAAISPKAEVSPEHAFLRRLSKENVGADAPPRMAADTSVAESAVSASDPPQSKNTKGTLMAPNLAASGSSRFKAGAGVSPPTVPDAASDAAPPEGDAAVRCVRRGSKGCMMAIGAFGGSSKPSAGDSAATSATTAAVPPAVPDSAPSQSAPPQRRNSKGCLMAAKLAAGSSFKSSAGASPPKGSAGDADVPPAAPDSPSQSAPLQRRSSKGCLMAVGAFGGSFKSSAGASDDYGGSFKVSADEADKPPTRFYAASDATPFASAPLQRRGSKEVMVAAEAFTKKSGAGGSAAAADAAAVAPAADAGAIAGLVRARAAKAAAEAEASASAAAAPSASDAAASETPPPPPPRRRSRRSLQPPSAGGSSTAASPSTAGGSISESGQPRRRVSRSSCVSPTPEVGAAAPTRVSRAPSNSSFLELGADLLGTRAQVGSASAGDLTSLDDVTDGLPLAPSRKKHETATSDAASSTVSSTFAI